MAQNYAEKRILEPHFYYQTPQHVLADKELSQRSKLKVLQNMRMDALYISEASMAVPRAGQTTNLERVERAIASLRQRLRLKK